MFSEAELNFSILVLYSLAEKWGKTPPAVYNILNTTGILDDYIIARDDMIHMLGTE